jgi:hypothetical protein
VRRWEHDPGELAQATGEFELVNIFGSPTGFRVNVLHGHPLPAAPRGQKWTFVGQDGTPTSTND